MSSHDTRQQQSSGRPREAAGDTGLPVLGLIERLEQACRPGTPPDVFVHELVAGFVALAEAHYGAFWRADAAGHLVPQQELMPRVSDRAAKGWAPVLEELAGGVIQQNIIRYHRVPEPADQLLTGETYMALGFPIAGQALVAGCVTIVVKGDSAVLSGAGVALLRLMSEFGVIYTSADSAAHFKNFYGSLSSAWDVVGEALAFTKPTEMAQVLADKARAALGAQRVSVGLVKRGKIHVTAISGEDMVDKRSNIVRLMQAAQTEVMISGEAGRYDRTAPDAERAEQLSRSPQHERLSRMGDCDVAYSVPLRKGEDLVAVWTFEFSHEALSAEARQVIDVTSGQVGPIVHLALENHRGVLKRVTDGLKWGAQWVFGKEHPWRKTAGAAICLVALFAIFGKIAFNISGSCRLAPSQIQVYAAPFDTTISAAPVKPGDSVKKGQAVVEFDKEELELQLRAAQSDATSAEKKLSTYLAQEKMPEYAETKAALAAQQAKIEILQGRLVRTVLTADTAGVVINGDLRQDIGRSVQMGQELLQVAPLGVLLLEMQIDQGDVGFVKAGQSGSFTTKAAPDTTIQFKVTAVRPMPEVRTGGSYFIAEAMVENAEGVLSPGMEGAAKIKVGRGKVIWVVSRKIVNWLRLHLWW